MIFIKIKIIFVKTTKYWINKSKSDLYISLIGNIIIHVYEYILTLETLVSVPITIDKVYNV